MPERDLSTWYFKISMGVFECVYMCVCAHAHERERERETSIVWLKRRSPMQVEWGGSKSKGCPLIGHKITVLGF